MKAVIFLLYFTGSAVAIPSYSLMYKLGIRGLKNSEKSNFRFLQDHSQPTVVPRIQYTEKTWTEKQNKTSKFWGGIQLPKSAGNFSEGKLEPNHRQLQGHNTSLRDRKAGNADIKDRQDHQEEPIEALRDDELREVLEDVNSVPSSKIKSRDRSRDRSRESSNVLTQRSGPAVAPSSLEADTTGDASPNRSNRGHYPVKRRDIVGYYQDNQDDPDMELHKGWKEDEWKYNKNAVEMYARSKMMEQIVMEEEADEEEEDEAEEGEEAEVWGGINYRDRRQTAQFNIPEDLRPSDRKENKYGDTPTHSHQLPHLTRQDKSDEQIEENGKSTPSELLKGERLNNSRMSNDDNPDAEWRREGDGESFQNQNQNSSDRKEQVIRDSPEAATYSMAIEAGSQIHRWDKSKNNLRVSNEEHDDSYRRRQEAMYQEGERIQSNGQGSINQEAQPGEEIKRGGNSSPSGTVDPKTSIERLVQIQPTYSDDGELGGSDNKEQNRSTILKHNVVKVADTENSIKTTGKPYNDGKSYKGSTKAPIPDPCRDFFCKTGKVCQADKGGKLSCVCRDPKTCPSTQNYVPRCCWTTTPRSPSQHGQWKRMMGVVVQQYLGAPQLKKLCSRPVFFNMGPYVPWGREDIASGPQVCGTDNRTYEDTCQLFGTKCHLEGTKVGHQLHLDYMGACKYIPPCTDYEAEQFPVRVRHWLKNVLMRLYKQDLDKGGFLTDKQRNKVKKIYLDEKRLPAGDHPTEILLRDFKKNYRTYTYPIHWHFNRLDQHPVDRKLTHSELAPFRASPVPMEHCVTRFFQGCDSDKDKHISLQEWCHCFGIKQEDIDENLLF